MYHGDHNLPGQLPLWDETCRKCRMAIEADYYGIWRSGTDALCASGELHEPSVMR